MILTEEQLGAINMYKTRKFLIIDGGPGVGKTTIIKMLIQIHPDVLLLAPVGAAADRIRQATGKEAYTLDKIAYTIGLIEKHYRGKVIIDESAMASLEDFVKLFYFLNPSSVCLLGDKDQLPPMQGTPIMRTLVYLSDFVPVAKLTINQRQLFQNTALFKTIQAFRSGDYVDVFQDETLKWVITNTDKEAIYACAIEFLKLNDAQMLAYTNATMRALNSKTEESKNRRVVCSENLYRPGEDVAIVSNGCVGLMSESGDTIEYANGFIDNKVTRKFESSFVPARSMTVKKAQGNEFEAPGLICWTTWHGPVPRELPITALSRFKTRVIVFTSKRCFEANRSSQFSTSINKELQQLIEARFSGNKKQKS